MRKGKILMNGKLAFSERFLLILSSNQCCIFTFVILLGAYTYDLGCWKDNTAQDRAIAGLEEKDGDLMDKYSERENPFQRCLAVAMKLGKRKYLREYVKTQDVYKNRKLCD